MTDRPNPSTKIPHRELGDPRTLRALAHPVRMQLLDQLIVHGPATATELAARLGETAANCSWHLRQLAKHGFLEEAEGGTGRQRPWRIRPQSTTISADNQTEPEFAAAREALLDVLLEQDLAALRAWQTGRASEPEQWRESAFAKQFNYLWLTAEELGSFKQALSELVERHLEPAIERIDPARRPAGSRPTRFVSWAVPSGPAHQADEPSTDSGEPPQ